MASIEVGEDQSTIDAGRLSRRNALKAGAALGVGAAVLAGPQIGRLGSTPAYAAACSQPWVDQGADCLSTSCPDACTTNTKYINYAGFTVANATSAGGCATPGAGTTATLTAPPAGFAQCRINVEVWETGKNDCVNQIGNLLASASTPGVVSGAVTLPAVVCASFADNSGIFTRITVECNRDTTIGCAP